jgi:hypothetical protein
LIYKNVTERGSREAKLCGGTNVSEPTNSVRPDAREYLSSDPPLKAAANDFQILVDTLLGRFLPAYKWRPKRRVIRAPKFHFADVAIGNHLARRSLLEPGADELVF